MSSLQSSAEAFVKKYEAHIHTGKSIMEAPTPEEQQARLDTFTKGMGPFFFPGVTSFGGIGPPAHVKDHEALVHMMKTFIGRYVELKIGFDGTLKSSKIQTLYDNGTYGSCLIEIIWTIHPHALSGIEPWDIRGTYGYRKLPTGEEGWELGYMDDEVAQLKKHVPNFYDGMGPPPQ